MVDGAQWYPRRRELDMQDTKTRWRLGKDTLM